MSGLVPAQAHSGAGLQRRGLFFRLLRNPLGVGSLVVVAIILVTAVFAEWLAPFPVDQVILSLADAPPFGEYFLGGDRTGRDIFSRLIVGTTGMVQSALIMAGTAIIIGVPFGLVAGYYGKAVDVVNMWVFNVLMAVPGVVILISLYTVVGATPQTAMAVFGVLCSPSYFWLVRNLVVRVKNELYIDAAHVSGLSDLRIIGRHVLIAIRAPVVIQTSFVASAAIGMQAGLEFLGLGDPNAPTWGGILAAAFNNIYVAPLQMLWPGLAIGLTTAALVLLGNALNDILEGTPVRPSKRSRRRSAARVLAAISPGSDRETSPAADPAALLSVRDLTVAYPNGESASVVVDGISFDLAHGEVLGLVGESGSGKTQTAFSILGLLPEEAVRRASFIGFNGVDLTDASEAQLGSHRGAGMAYIPQEPMSNLDPSFRIGAQLVHGIRAQSGMGRKQAREHALSMLARVGINDPKRTFESYPHQISGGMAQRVLIAGAIACKPSLLIADEPTTALDVTVQAEVLDLLRDLQRESGMAILMVTHNFGVVADLCSRVAVMQRGRIVESGEVREVFRNPQHPYTRSLLGAILDLDDLRPATDRKAESCPTS